MKVPRDAVLAAASVALTLLAIEAGLRLSGWPASSDRQDCGVEKLLCRYDPVLGWRGKPNLREAGFQWDDGPYTVETNSGGWRDTEHLLEKPPGVTRVLVLGDSFTWGHNVRFEKSYPRVLELRLGEGFEVLSLGMPGYATDQELLVLRSDGFPYSPDIVVLGLYMDDIFFNGNISYRYPKPHFVEAPDGSLSLEGVPVPYLKSQLRVVEFLKRHLHDIRSMIDAPSAEYRKRASLNVMYEEYRDAEDWRITKRILRTINEECRQRDVKFVVVLIPFDFQTEDGKGRVPQQVLVDFGRDIGIPVLDLLPVFLEQGGMSLYFQTELHWNEKGHAVAASAIHRFLAGLGYLH